jgi:hypothetical protein
MVTGHGEARGDGDRMDQIDMDDIIEERNLSERGKQADEGGPSVIIRLSSDGGYFSQLRIVGSKANSHDQSR